MANRRREAPSARECAQLSLLADRACVGLSALARGQLRADLLRDGARFCDSASHFGHLLAVGTLIRGVTAMTPVGGAAHPKPLAGEEDAQAQRTLRNAKAVLSRAMAGEPVTAEESRDTQRQLHAISLVFYRRQGQLERQARLTRSLRAYA
jgi:hypothetical protein